MSHFKFFVLIWIIFVSQQAFAEIYAYTNSDGDYIVSQTKPTDRNLSYAVLTDDGEFVRMVEGKNKRVPISHWRPFFMPKEPHPLDGREIEFEEREPNVEIEEVDSNE